MIEGHTDDVPFRKGSSIKDNWDLSVLRATSIVRILLDGSGIDPTRLTVAGRGEFLPVDPADTPGSQEKEPPNRDYSFTRPIRGIQNPGTLAADFYRQQHQPSSSGSTDDQKLHRQAGSGKHPGVRLPVPGRPPEAARKIRSWKVCSPV